MNRHTFKILHDFYLLQDFKVLLTILVGILVGKLWIKRLNKVLSCKLYNNKYMIAST